MSPFAFPEWFYQNLVLSSQARPNLRDKTSEGHRQFDFQSVNIGMMCAGAWWTRGIDNADSGTDDSGIRAISSCMHSIPFILMIWIAILLLNPSWTGA